MAFPSPATALRHRFERRSRRLEVAREVRDSLVSLAGLTGRPVCPPAGEPVGRVADVVAHWDTGEPYPSLSGLVVRVGRAACPRCLAKPPPGCARSWRLPRTRPAGR